MEAKESYTHLSIYVLYISLQIWNPSFFFRNVKFEFYEKNTGEDILLFSWWIIV